MIRNLNPETFCRYIVLGIIGVFISSAINAQCTNPKFTVSPTIGINVAPVDALPFINLWYLQGAGGHGTVVLGNDGWPINGVTHTFRGIGGEQKAGIYKVSYKGKIAQLTYRQSWNGTIQNEKDNFPTPGYAYFEINYPTAPTGLAFNIKDHIEDVKIIIPGYELDEKRTFEPVVGDYYQNYKVLRFKNFLAADYYESEYDHLSNTPQKDITHLCEWNNRKKPNTIQDIGSQGGAIEYAVEMCNTWQKDGWFNIPVKASDDFIKQLAIYLKTNVNPKSLIYLEQGNEPWNTHPAFHSFYQIKEMVRADYLSGDPKKQVIFEDYEKGGWLPDFSNQFTDVLANTYGAWTPQRRWQVRRSKEISEIFASVFGKEEINNRVRVVVNEQPYGPFGEGWIMQSGIEMYQAKYAPNKMGDDIYAIGIPAYLNGEHDANENEVDVNNKGALLNAMNRNVDSFFDEYQCWNSPACTRGGPNMVAAMAFRARTHKMKFIAYEGGPEYGWGDKWTTAKRDALRDPEMYNIVKKAMNNWFGLLGAESMFLKFDGTVFPEYKNMYALGEYWDGRDKSPQKRAFDEIATSPIAAYNRDLNNVIPGNFPAWKQIFRQREEANRECIESGWPSGAATAKGGRGWGIAAEKNGIYQMRIKGKWWSQNSAINIVLDGKVLHSNLKFWDKTYNASIGPETARWSDVIEFEVPFGVHSLWIEHLESQYTYCEFEFKLKNEIPPVTPAMIGERQVCPSSPNAKYSVAKLDISVCEYIWKLDAAATAKGASILANKPQNGTQEASGQGASTIFIDWANTPAGTYKIEMYGENTFGKSLPTSMDVTVLPVCGFTLTPTSLCLNPSLTVVAEDKTNNSVSWNWDFGSGSSPQYSTSKTPPPIKYNTSGTKTVKLVVSDGANPPKSSTFFNYVNVTNCNSPAVVPKTYCVGETPVPLTAALTNTGTNLKWYTSKTSSVSVPTPTPSTATEGDVSYWVTQMNGGIESDKAELVVKVSKAPSAPFLTVPNPLVYCAGALATANDIISRVKFESGVTQKWYLGNATTSNNSPTTPNTALVANTSWFVTQSIGTCESGKTELKVVVVNGPQFTVEPMSPQNCGDKGKIVLKGLTAVTTYQVAYNTVPAASQTTDASGNITFDLPQGNYRDFKVSLAGCSSTVATSYPITDPASPIFTVVARQPKECGALGAIVLKGMKNNTAYKISYNNKVDEPISSIGDSISIALPKGDYTGIKVNLSGCMKTDAGTYKLSDPVIIPPVLTPFDFIYCQKQEINLTDITSRVKGEPGYTLKWYAVATEAPTATPTLPNTLEAGNKSIWVSQANENGCESDRKEIKIVINPSTALTVAPKDPTQCGVADGKLEISGLGNIKEYNIEYKKEGQSQAIAKLFSSQTGTITIGNLQSGNYSSVTATPLSGSSCFTNSSAILTLKELGAPTTPPVITGAADYCAGSTPAPLTATASSGGVINWFTNPELTASAGTGVSPTINQLTATTTFYAIEIVNGNCKSPQAKATINIVANPKEQEVTGTGGAAKCNGTGYALSLKSSETDVIYKVYKDNVETSITLDGRGAAIPFPDQSEKGIYTIKAESKIKTCKADMTGSMTITAKVNPKVFEVAGGLKGCEGATAANANITLSGSQDNTVYRLMPSMEVIPGNGSPIAFAKTATKENNNTYTIVATNTQTGCDTVMDKTAVIDIKAGVGEPTLVGALSYCNQSPTPTKIEVIADNATEQVWSIAPATAGTIDNGNVTWSNTYTGIATITVVVSNSVCGPATKVKSIETTVTATPQVSPITGDSLVCRGNIVTYQVLPQVGITYNWSINANTMVEEDDSKGTITVTYMEDLSKEGATLTVTPESEGCGLGNPQTKTINKDNGCDLFVPNILTPSTADKNSVWQLEGVDNYPKLSIQIFNRWGAEVHSHNGKYDKPWDGTTNGNALPTATYYYVIDKKDGTSKITGSVTVVRE